MERRIGEYVADLIPDEATLQMGIGAIPTAVGMCLEDKKHLGVHTEMFTDPLVELVEKGVVDCSAKTLDPHKVVAAFMMGSPRLYKWVDGNPMLELRGVDYTNDTATIRKQRRMTAVNSAIEVDLTGQVCADSLGHTHVQRRRRADGLRARRVPGAGGAGDHRPAVHHGRRQGLAHHLGAV